MAETWKKLAFEDDVVLKTLFDADTFLYATGDNTPAATSPADVMAALSGHAAAAFAMNAQNLTGVGTIGCGTITSTGNLIIADAGNIGSTSDTDAIAIAAGGEVTLSQTLLLSDVVNAGVDTDKFLVLDGTGNVDFRTGAEVLNDIGASAGDVDTSGTPEALDFARFTDLNTIEGRSYAEVMGDLSGGAAAAFDWNGQQLQNMLLHIVANDAAKTALSSALGMVVWQTDDACVYVCSEGE